MQVVWCGFSGEYKSEPILTSHDSARFSRCLMLVTYTVASWLSPNCRMRSRTQLSSRDLDRRYVTAYMCDQTERYQVFSFLVDVPVDMIRSPRNELVTAAVCQLIASSITLKEISLSGESSVPHWRTILDLGIKHRKSTVQEAAASALAEVSKFVDCSAVVQRYVNTLMLRIIEIRPVTYHHTIAHSSGTSDRVRLRCSKVLHAFWV